MSAKQPCRLVPLLRCAMQNKRLCRLHAVKLSETHAMRVALAVDHGHQGDALLTRKYSSDAIPPPSLDGEVQYPDKIKSIVKQISCLTIAEVADLNKLLKQTLGIQDAPVMAMGSVAAPAVSQEEEEEDEVAAAPKEQTQFTVKLTKFDEASKVKLIKLIKTLMSGMNLVQAKKFVESAPQAVKSDISKTEAGDIKKQIEEAGGTCEID